MPDAATRIARHADGDRRSPKSFGLGFAALVVAVAGIVATVYLQFIRERNPEVALIEPANVDPVTDIPLVSEDLPPPLIELPREEPQASDLPGLDESDEAFAGWLTELFGARTVAELIVPERLIRNIVVTVDNLPRQQLAPQQRPLRPTPGAFMTAGEEEELVIAPENYERYAAVMALVRGTDPRVPAALYSRFRPLFQQAYEELGYPSRSFQQRLVEVIDHLLATPEIADPIRLVQPSVAYRYADRQIESLSAGQKLLIRMGPDNARTIKEKLRELRAELDQY